MFTYGTINKSPMPHLKNKYLLRLKVKNDDNKYAFESLDIDVLSSLLLSISSEPNN